MMKMQTYLAVVEPGDTSNGAQIMNSDFHVNPNPWFQTAPLQIKCHI